MKQEHWGNEEARRRLSGGLREQAPWSKAKPTWACLKCGALALVDKTTCLHGQPSIVRFASKWEATCYGTLLRTLGNGERILRQVRFPLLALAGDEAGKPASYISIDFIVVFNGQMIRAVDPKGRVSRDWTARVAAFEVGYGIKVEQWKRPKSEKRAFRGKR